MAVGVEYQVANDKVQLTTKICREYLVSGDGNSVTDQELVMFMNLCKFNRLNPWLREAYCIKYGNNAATMVVGKEAFQKRAEANKNYDGSEAGVAVVDKDGKLIYRTGSLVLPGEELVGGYAEVWRKDREHSVRIEVSFEEYAAKKKDGTLNSQWSGKPGTMIRKVALVQALREAFPGEIGGMYTAEEQGVEEPAGEKDIEVVAVQDAFEESKPEEVKSEEPKQDQEVQQDFSDFEEQYSEDGLPFK